MTDVLLVAGSRPAKGVLIDAVKKFHDQGARVYLVGFFELDKLARAAGVDGARSLLESGKHYGETFKRSARTGGTSSHEVWMYAERDPWVEAHARRASVLVALDQHAVYTVWELAQRHEHADARFGLQPALKAAEARTKGSSRGQALPHPRELARRGKRRIGLTARLLPRTAMSGRVLRTKAGARAWRTAVSSLPVSDGVRARLASTVSARLNRVNRPRAADLVVDEAATRIDSPRVRADLRAAAAEHVLASGRVPAGLIDAVQTALDCADDEFTNGHVDASLARFVDATKLAFHRAVHFDGRRSLLAEDPAAFSAPFRTSTFVQAVTAPRGRKQPVRRPTDRPQRILVATRVNANFLSEIREYLGQHEDVEVKFVDFAKTTALNRFSLDAATLAKSKLSKDSALSELLEEQLRPHLDWADTVFIDWALATAIYFTMIDPGDTRLVVRLHSFEAFTLWPHLIDYSRVEDMIFVSDHLRELAMAAVPALASAEAPRTHVIPNAMALQRFVRPKHDDARFNLGLVGVSHMAKDPMWALEVTRLLREQDDRYRLIYVGANLNPGSSATTLAYTKKLRKRLRAMVEQRGVVRIGQTDDVPAVLQDVGVMLSTSVRESFHCALVEGAASGAVPVVRDWPFFAGQAHGARTLFPQDWVVSTPEEAVKRILSMTGDEVTWREAGQAASRHALDQWDWSVVRRRFDGPLLGLDTAERVAMPPA